MAGKRAIRIANCSGAASDPGIHMLNQAKYGDVDVITGDYLAEINLATHAEAMSRGDHPGYASTALDGLELSMEIINEKRIKIIINGGALNPKGLAEEAQRQIRLKGYNLKVAYVDGDNMLQRAKTLLYNSDTEALPHLDSVNASVTIAKDATGFLTDSKKHIVSVNAYLGIRAITRGLKDGADIIICGRVADASPVIAAAQWWHGWSDDAYDELAGSLLAGHLIECSTYVTGANFAGFFKYKIAELLDLGLPIAEIFDNGECVITKHESLRGMVTEDTVKCQLLYELQGNIYLNSDVKADLTHVMVQEEASNRIRVSGVRGYPPPSTTKLAVFYRGGYQCEMVINATGYATAEKYALQEAQIRTTLQQWGLADKFDKLEFQRAGIPEPNPRTQMASTTYLRIFAQAQEPETLQKITAAWMKTGMQHFAGMHCTMDLRTLAPIPFLAYYPAIVSQNEVEEAINILSAKNQADITRTVVGPPVKTEPLAPRENYETRDPVDLAEFGPTIMAPLGDIALGRSGDKGANINFGVFVHTLEEWNWLRSFMTRAKMQELMGDDWSDSYFVERVEMPAIMAVHFVIYGPLGRGVSSSSLLDALGKGFGEYIRYAHVPIPEKFLRGKVNGHAN